MRTRVVQFWTQTAKRTLGLNLHQPWGVCWCALRCLPRQAARLASGDSTWAKNGLPTPLLLEYQGRVPRPFFPCAHAPTVIALKKVADDGRLPGGDMQSEGEGPPRAQHTKGSMG